MKDTAQISVAREESLTGEVALTDRDALAEERTDEREQELAQARKGQSSRQNARMKMRRLEDEVQRTRGELEELRQVRAEGPESAGTEPRWGQAAGHIERLREENDLWRRRAQERLMQDDLRQIGEAYPDEGAGDVRELGEDFLRLRAAGVGALPAYAAIREAGRRKNMAPPSTGPALSSLPEEGEFFSSRELDQLGERDLGDPDVLRKAIRSMRALSKNTLNRRK